jgi:hypothetical protein
MRPVTNSQLPWRGSSVQEVTDSVAQIGVLLQEGRWAGGQAGRYFVLHNSSESYNELQGFITRALIGQGGKMTTHWDQMCMEIYIHAFMVWCTIITNDGEWTR